MTMRLTFLGTRGNIRIASSVHRFHASLLVETDDVRLLVDAGDDWRGRLDELAPDAILLTHAHPDHAGALREGAPCPVYATAETHDLLARYPLDRHTLPPRALRHLGPIAFSAYPAEHSLLAPAVGFRLEEGGSRVFYIPDVLELEDAGDALRGVALYIGDGATYGRPIVRRRDGRAFGHATIETQLDWCATYSVPEAVFTHCGSRIVRRRPDEMAQHVALLGQERDVQASVATDGRVIEVRPAVCNLPGQLGTHMPGVDHTDSREGEMPQIYEVLKQEHRKIEQMLDKMTRGKADGRMFGQLATDLQAHQKAEEKVVYPDLMRPEQTHGKALEGVEEHHVAELILKEMQKLPPKDERFQAKLMVLKENVTHHVQEEERTLFPGARKAMGKEWAEQTAEKFEQQEQSLKKRLSGTASSAKKPAAASSRTRTAAASKPKAATATKPKAATASASRRKTAAASGAKPATTSGTRRATPAAKPKAATATKPAPSRSKTGTATRSKSSTSRAAASSRRGK